MFYSTYTYLFRFMCEYAYRLCLSAFENIIFCASVFILYLKLGKIYNKVMHL